MRIENKILENLICNPVYGIIIANEVIDAFPVERIVFRDDKLWRQGVSIREGKNSYSLQYSDLVIPDNLMESIEEVSQSTGVKIPPEKASNGWTSEWHFSYKDWIESISKILVCGTMLIIDYGLGNLLSVQRAI